ncbi:hypothetical protein LCGC14_1572100 [marine sediment metagenome]|uniref:Uncharacterized protein n=1 Tax=marine sediment metagenome TaxID=412755 RepID=A0A0F9IJB2_9ZZZZ
MTNIIQLRRNLSAPNRAPKWPFRLNRSRPLAQGLLAGTFFASGVGDSFDLVSEQSDWAANTATWTSGRGGVGLQTDNAFISIPDPGIGAAGTIVMRFQEISADGFGRYFESTGVSELVLFKHNTGPGTASRFVIAGNTVTFTGLGDVSDGAVHTLIADWEDGSPDVRELTVDGILGGTSGTGFGVPAIGGSLMFGNLAALNRDFNAIWYFIAIYNRRLNAAEKWMISINPAQIIEQPGRVTYFAPAAAAGIVPLRMMMGLGT